MNSDLSTFANILKNHSDFDAMEANTELVTNALEMCSKTDELGALEASILADFERIVKPSVFEIHAFNMCMGILSTIRSGEPELDPQNFSDTCFKQYYIQGVVQDQRFGQFIINSLRKYPVTYAQMPPEVDCFYDNSRASEFFDWLFNLHEGA